MITDKLAQASKQFDVEFAADNFHPMSPEDRQRWDRVKSKSKSAAPKTTKDERDSFARLSLEGLERAYGVNEPEYALDSINEVNPDYERK